MRPFQRPQPQPSIDWGVEYVYVDTEPGFVTGGWSEDAARGFVADHSGQSWYPRPVRVMRRRVGPWQPLEDEEGAA